MLQIDNFLVSRLDQLWTYLQRNHNFNLITATLINWILITLGLTTLAVLDYSPLEAAINLFCCGPATWSHYNRFRQMRDYAQSALE